MPTKLRGKNRYYHMLDLPGSMPSTGLIQYHREMAQRMLKRTLKPDECVVRKDGDRSNDRMENLMVFASKGGARRYYSKHSQEFLFRREDGVYDYDWEAINQQKQKTSENYKNKMNKLKERNEKINVFIKDNPNCTLEDIANNFFNGKIATARNHLYTHDIKLTNINYSNSNKGVEKIRSMTREELILYLSTHHVSGKELAEKLGTNYYSIANALSERGISTIGKHKKFKHLTRQAIIDAMASKPSKQKLARMLGVFEENLEVELWKLGIKHGYKMVFVKGHYEMPKEEDYESNEIEQQKSEMTIAEHEQPIEDVVSEVQDINKENKFTLDDAYSIGLTFNDIKFLTQKSTKDLIDSKNIDISMDNINTFIEMRKILTRENIIALYKAGHSTNDIAAIYGYNGMYVRHIADTI